MAQGVLEGHPSSDGALILSINGALDTTSTGQAWRRALQLLTEHQPKRLIVDASHLTYCDGAGAALLLELRRRQESRRQPYEIQSLDPAYQALLDLYGRWDAQRPEPLAPADSPVEQIGRATVAVWRDVVVLIAFVGQLSAALASAARRPRLVRWKDALLDGRIGWRERAAHHHAARISAGPHHGLSIGDSYAAIRRRHLCGQPDWASQCCVNWVPC